jgi:hypothetical protein
MAASRRPSCNKRQLTGPNRLITAASAMRRHQPEPAAAGVLLGGGSELHRRQQRERPEQHTQAGDRPRPRRRLAPEGDVRASEGTRDVQARRQRADAKVAGLGLQAEVNRLLRQGDLWFSDRLSFLSVDYVRNPSFDNHLTETNVGVPASVSPACARSLGIPPPVLAYIRSEAAIFET